jgi:dynein heavy chain 2
MQFRIHILKLQFALTNYITVPNNLPYVVFFFFPSAHITPQHVIQKLAQMCLVVSSSNGRVFRPKECDRLILYLKDLNLANPDKYGTCMLIAFLQQILTYGGFYDNLEWVGLEAVTVVSTMTAGTGLGRHLLNTRFTSVMRIISINEPDKVNDFI